MGMGPGFVFKYVYTCNNIEIDYLILNKKQYHQKRAYKLVFEGGGVVVVGCSRELPTTLKNEPLMLVFEDGNGGGGAKERPPSKTSIRGSFLRMEVVLMVPRSDHPRKRAYSARFQG